MRPLASRSTFDRDLPIFSPFTFALFVMNDTIISVELPARRAYSPEGKPKAPPHWAVYAIQNAAGRIYIGHTGNLTQRLNAHNAGLVRSTRSGRSWRLIAIEECGSQSAARWTERSEERSRGRRLKWLQQRLITT